MAVKDFKLSVNGREHTVKADEDMPLLYALRNVFGIQTAGKVPSADEIKAMLV